MKEGEDRILRLDKSESNLSSKTQEILEEIKREPVLYCPEERLQRYREKNIEEYIVGKLGELERSSGRKVLVIQEGSKSLFEGGTTAENVLAEFLCKIDPRLSGIVKIAEEYKIEREYDRKIECRISEQGTGIKSVICIAADIIFSLGKDIILIDEPELGLNPAAKQVLLEWLLELSEEKQVFVATHDPSFTNPLIIGGKDVRVFLYSPLINTFRKVDPGEDPNFFAGFMPHTASLKEIHIYVEGVADAYAYQAMLFKYLKDKLKAQEWYKIFNRIGFYHLRGDMWSHLLYTIPTNPKSVVILDKPTDENKKKEIEEKIEKLNNYGAGKIFPNFEFCEDLNDLKDSFQKEGVCPVYCLTESDVKEYLGVKEKKVKIIANAAWSLREIPNEFCKIFEIVLSKYLPSDEQKVEEIVFYDDFEKFEGWKPYGRDDKWGEIEPSSDVAYKGKHSLKKDKYGDPSGGYKKLPKVINRKEVECIIFSGWIYRPSDRMGGIADRLAIEDENFNGYGFFAGHKNLSIIAIEKRTKGDPSRRLKEVEWEPIENDWYKFELIIRKDKLDLYIHDKDGKVVRRIEGVVDDEYDSFDRVVVHGGFIYYVDCIEVKIVK